MCFDTVTKLLFLAPFVCILRVNQCAEPPKNASLLLNAPSNDPNDLLFRELSAEAYFNLPSHQPGDTAKRFRRLGEDRYNFNNYAWMNQPDKDFEKANSAAGLSFGAEVVDTDRYTTDQKTKTISTLHPDAFTIFHLCYAVSYLFRKGSKRLHHYYNLRSTYSDHMQFEIGYLTQTIMATYQNVLELYEYSARMVSEGDNKIGRPHLFFFYKNILEDCRKIIHLCNMMHEITRKYKTLQYSGVNQPWLPVIYDPTQKFQDRTGNFYRFNRDGTTNAYLGEYERGIQGMGYQKIVHEDPAIFERIKKNEGIHEAELERRKKLAKPNRQDFDMHGFFTWNATTRRTRTWKPKDGSLEYGWSNESN